MAIPSGFFLIIAKWLELSTVTDKQLWKCVFNFDRDFVVDIKTNSPHLQE